MNEGFSLRAFLKCSQAMLLRLIWSEIAKSPFCRDKIGVSDSSPQTDFERGTC